MKSLMIFVNAICLRSIQSQRSRVFAALCLLFPIPGFALTENYVAQPWDYVFYTFALSGVVFASLIITAYREYKWLAYCFFAALLLLNAAAMDGSLAYFIGPGDFVVWVVPFLIYSSVTVYGYAMIALQLDAQHKFARYKFVFIGLAGITALFPLSSYFWLTKISIVEMVNTFFVQIKWVVRHC